MSSVQIFVLQSTLLFLPALVAVGGGLAAFRLRHRQVASRLVQSSTAVLLLVLGAAAWFVQLGFVFILLPAIVGLSIAFSLMVGTPLAVRSFAMIRAQATQGRMAFVLLSLCPLLFAGGFWQINKLTAPQMEMMDGVQDFAAPSLVIDKTLQARTDHGTDIPLFKAPNLATDAHALKGDDGLPHENSPLPYRAVRLTEADCVSNCVGWVFAGAHAWIQCRDVQQIIDDNGYQQIKAPQAGDLVIYRDLSGEIVHVAKVAAILENGQPLIESKWGYQGVFLHLPQGTPYGSDCVYYHSPRSNHLLVLSTSADANSHGAVEAAP